MSALLPVLHSSLFCFWTFRVRNAMGWEGAAAPMMFQALCFKWTDERHGPWDSFQLWDYVGLVITQEYGQVIFLL